MEKVEKALAALEKIVAEFLLKNGGYGNGYDTWAKGYVTARCHHTLEWQTPAQNEMSMKQVKSLGSDLNEQLMECLEEHGFDHCNVTCFHVEHGCYHTTVEITFKKPVELFSRDKT